MCKTAFSRWFTGCVLFILAMVLFGCEVLGPRTLRGGRTQYNEAIKTTDVDQLLLNIVRMRFNDRPYFLEIASISSTAELAASLGGKTTFGDIDENSVQGGLTYLERPTIIYQPLSGEKFVRQLLEPVDLPTILLLRGAGWEIDDILRVFANRINGVVNASTGADSTPEGVPEYKEFLQVVEALDKLDDRGGVTIAAGESEQVEELVFQILPKLRQSEEYRKLARILNLDPDAKQIKIRIGLNPGGNDEIIIETRPIMSAMFYLGQSIEIPEEEIKSGSVNYAVDETGKPFDWQKVHDGLIRIRTSENRPSDPYVAVKYYDGWFYIPKTDVDSRETLTMLNIVLTLKAGGVPSKAPVLTLPVGR